MNESTLTAARENLVKKLQTLFDDKAVEAHLFGSLARGNPDAYSDIDIWYVFQVMEYAEVFAKRFEYYTKLGEIVHFCEAPQNAPVGGVHTALLIKTGGVITVVDIYLCPLSTAFITEESKKLFGIDLPMGTAGFNPQKVQVNNDYRIDFLICFIFGTIKKLARGAENPLEGVLRQYEHLYKDYGIPVPALETQEQTLNTLKMIIENTQKVTNERQKQALVTVLDFAKSVLG